MPAPWRSRVLVAVTSAFVLLDFYSSHFIALPYYTGVIRHNSAGSMPAFHISDAIALGYSEWIGRMLINRPQILSPLLLVLIWGTFIIMSAALPFVCGLYRKIR
jgi:hypothetical protein